MREEISRQESALNGAAPASAGIHENFSPPPLTDAELAGVAGGGMREEVATKVVQLCYGECPGGEHCSSGNPVASLHRYLKDHGIDSVPDYRHCPYYIP